LIRVEKLASHFHGKWKTDLAQYPSDTVDQVQVVHIDYNKSYTPFMQKFRRTKLNNTASFPKIMFNE